MKKQTTRAKSTTKAKAAIKAKTTVKAVKATKKPKTPVVAKKKTTKRKGPIHHAKRIYHLTPKFVHGALVGAFVGMLLVTWIGSTGEAHANPPANSCIKTNGLINVNLQNANVQVKTSDCNTNRTFVMKAWYAPSATGKPHDQQRLYWQTEPVVVKKNSNEWTKINVKALPDGCFYQYDLVDVTNPSTNGEGNPIVRAAVGGNRDCTPKPEYACNSMTVKQAGRVITVDSFRVTEVNATLNKVVINWGDETPATTVQGSPVGTTHTYATGKDSFTIQAAAYFTVKEKNGMGTNVVVAKQACTAQVSFTPVTPGNQEVCEFSTGKIVQVPEGPYDTTKYGPTSAKECNPTVTVTSTSSTLTKTGPAAVLTILACAAIGGYVFHRTHHHVKAKKHRRAAAH